MEKSVISLWKKPRVPFSLPYFTQNCSVPINRGPFESYVRQFLEKVTLPKNIT